MRIVIAMCSIFLLFPSCKVQPPQAPLVQTVAVLLFDSESNELDAPDIMQRLVYLALQPSEYRVLDIKETNQKLNQIGFMEGGQLAAIDPVKLGREFGVQAFMFGNVESFGYVNIGVYASRKVNLELKLVDTTTGETLWENSGRASTAKVAADKDDIGKNFAEGLADQAVDKLLKTPLEEEAKLATMRALSSLPGFSFAGFAHDEQTPGQVKQGSKDVLKKLIRRKQ